MKLQTIASAIALFFGTFVANSCDQSNTKEMDKRGNISPAAYEKVAEKLLESGLIHQPSLTERYKGGRIAGRIGKLNDPAPGMMKLLDVVVTPATVNGSLSLSENTIAFDEFVVACATPDCSGRPEGSPHELPVTDEFSFFSEPPAGSSSAMENGGSFSNADGAADFGRRRGGGGCVCRPPNTGGGRGCQGDSDCAPTGTCMYPQRQCSNVCKDGTSYCGINSGNFICCSQGQECSGELNKKECKNPCTPRRCSDGEDGNGGCGPKEQKYICIDEIVNNCPTTRCTGGPPPPPPDKCESTDPAVNPDMQCSSYCSKSGFSVKQRPCAPFPDFPDGGPSNMCECNDEEKDKCESDPDKQWCGTQCCDASACVFNEKLESSCNTSCKDGKVACGASCCPTGHSCEWSDDDQDFACIDKRPPPPSCAVGQMKCGEIDLNGKPFAICCEAGKQCKESPGSSTGWSCESSATSSTNEPTTTSMVSTTITTNEPTTTSMVSTTITTNEPTTTSMVSTTITTNEPTTTSMVSTTITTNEPTVSTTPTTPTTNVGTVLEPEPVETPE